MSTYYNYLSSGTILHGNQYNYKIARVLGQGNYGITYLANLSLQGQLGQLDSNVYVTIKEFFMKEINGREGTNVTSSSKTKGGLFYDYKEKFAREAKNLSKLKHPNIVNVMDYFEANNTCYYVMEYLSGGDLDTLIEKLGGLGEEETIRIAKQIGSALSFMHQNKMLHLDLKPKNVMLNSLNDAILIDFGLSKQYDSFGEPESSTTVGRGTPGYAPIEQSNYQDGHGFPVTMDIYAFGATMYKMLIGERAAEASVILNEGFPDVYFCNRGISQDLTNLIKQAMSPLKKDRFQTVDFLINKLEENTIVELPLLLPDDFESIEVYHDEGSIALNNYYKFFISKDKSSTFEVQWGDNFDSINLSSSLYNDLVHHFNDARLTYTLKETGDNNFAGGDNTRITISYKNGE